MEQFIMSQVTPQKLHNLEITSEELGFLRAVFASQNLQVGMNIAHIGVAIKKKLETIATT